jgi:predicted DNA-binding transcriptional regulator AlpA
MKKSEIENPDFKVEPKYFTAEQCAVRFGISLRQFKNLVALRELPKPVTFGGSVRWSLRSLEKFDSLKFDEQCKASPCLRNAKV